MSSERHQQSLQGVLRFAIENSKTDEGLDPTKIDEMELERKKFLENALKSMTVDVIEELEKAIRTLESKTTTVEEKVEALNVVRDYAGNIDFANNFVTIGGTRVVLDCLKSEDPKLKICAAYVIAELAQNNPFCQKHFLNTEAVNWLMLYTKKAPDIASSSMHAISSIVRNFPEGSAMFIERGGLECILECVKSQHSNVFVKGCFLLRALATEYPAVRDKFVQLGAISILAACVDQVYGFDLKIEIVLAALDALTQTDEGKKELQKTDIYPTLQNMIEINEGKAECEEILRDSAALLDCFKEAN